MNDLLTHLFKAAVDWVAQSSASAPTTAAPPPGSPSTGVIVNGQAVDGPATGALPAGRYWYDHDTGAWGHEGGPTAGFVGAGLALPGPLAADASGGGHGRLSGVFINGRELHPLDVARLQASYGAVWPGHWWVDAGGQFGPLVQGRRGPALGRLGSAASAASASGPWALASADGKRWVGVDADGVASANGVNGERWFGS